MRFSGRRDSRRTSARIRTLPVRGKGDDAGRFYRCSNCGFVCDLDRDRLEGENAKAGNDTQIVITASDPANGIPLDYVAGLEFPFVFGSHFGRMQRAGVAVLSGDLNFFHTAMEEAPDGDPQPIYHAMEPEVRYGCPFCGTTNWKGK